KYVSRQSLLFRIEFSGKIRYPFRNSDKVFFPVTLLLSVIFVPFKGEDKVFDERISSLFWRTMK
ncbi:MAG: hypothetical protein ACYSWZ_14160, partial [Planctomycetota bacterium]